MVLDSPALSCRVCAFYGPLPYDPRRIRAVGGAARDGRALAFAQRRFRRLVLVDRAQDTPPAIFDGGRRWPLTITVLPVREGQFLLPDAVARLVPKRGSGASEGAIACVRGSENCRAAEPRSRRCGRRFCAPTGQSFPVVAPSAEPLGAGFLYALSLRARRQRIGLQGSSACLAGCAALAAAIVAAVWTGRWVGGCRMLQPQPSCGASPDVFRWPLAILPAGVRGGDEKGRCAAVKQGVKIYHIINSCYLYHGNRNYRTQNGATMINDKGGCICCRRCSMRQSGRSLDNEYLQEFRRLRYKPQRLTRCADHPRRPLSTQNHPRISGPHAHPDPE